jgi:hypothetical protein
MIADALLLLQYWGGGAFCHDNIKGQLQSAISNCTYSKLNTTKIPPELYTVTGGPSLIATMCCSQHVWLHRTCSWYLLQGPNEVRRAWLPMVKPSQLTGLMTGSQGACVALT